MPRDELDIEALIGDPLLLAKVKSSIEEAKKRVQDTVVNYRFVMQMLPANTPIPSEDLVTIITAKAYAEAIMEWDGDMILPMVFAVLTMKEMARGDI